MSARTSSVPPLLREQTPGEQKERREREGVAYSGFLCSGYYDVSDSQHTPAHKPVEEAHNWTLFLRRYLVVTVSVCTIYGRGLGKPGEVATVVKIDDGARVRRHHEVAGAIVVADRQRGREVRAQTGGAAHRGGVSVA